MNAIAAGCQEKYQVSPIRSVPTEWDEKTLLDTVGMKKDLIVAGPFGSNLKVSDYRDEGIPIIRLQNIDYGKFIDKEIKYISPEKARELAYHSFRAGDLVLAKLGDPIGKTCIVPDYFQDGVVVADVVRIRVADGLADKNFIMYSLNSVTTKNQLINGTIGSTRPRVNLDQIRDIRISVPPLNEQRKIAAILSYVDAAIMQTDAIIVQTERMKKGLMQELFTKGIGHSEFKDSELGRIPKEWTLAKLGDVCNFFDYLRIPVKKSDRRKRQGVYPYYGAQGVIDWVNDFIFDGSYLLVAEDGENLRSKILPIAYQVSGKFWVNNHAHILKPKDDYSIGYVEYVLNFINIDKYIIGSAQPKLNQDVLRKIEIPWAGDSERVKITNILSIVDKKHKLSIEYKNKLGTLKNGLMQDLLTGRVRVKVDGHA